MTEQPELTITTSTGFGAILSAQILPRPEFQGEIKQVIDCITPRDGIVGFINGEPYYGSFHVMSNGVKMTGAKHSGNDIIIYDTPQESRTSRGVVASTIPMTTVSSPQVQTNVSNTTTPSQTTTSAPSQTGTTDTSSQQETGQSYTPPDNNNSGGGGSSGSNGSGGGYSGY